MNNWINGKYELYGHDLSRPIYPDLSKKQEYLVRRKFLDTFGFWINNRINGA
jgi:hypothetical protein